MESLLYFLAAYLMYEFLFGYINLYNLAPYWIIKPRIEEKALKNYKKYLRSLKWQE